MSACAGGSIIPAMSTPHHVAKVLLLAESRPTSPKPGSVPVKRYRLARLAVTGPASPAAPYEHLRRTYD